MESAMIAMALRVVVNGGAAVFSNLYRDLSDIF